MCAHGHVLERCSRRLALLSLLGTPVMPPAAATPTTAGMEEETATALVEEKKGDDNGNGNRNGNRNDNGNAIEDEDEESLQMWQCHVCAAVNLTTDEAAVVGTNGRGAAAGPRSEAGAAAGAAGAARGRSGALLRRPFEWLTRAAGAFSADTSGGSAAPVDSFCLAVAAASERTCVLCRVRCTRMPLD